MIKKKGAKNYWQDTVTVSVLLVTGTLATIFIYLKSQDSRFSMRHSATSRANLTQAQTSSPPQNTHTTQQDKTNPFSQESYPKSACGDIMPRNTSDFPVTFYPVYIEFTENNLNTVKSQICRDAYRKTREQTGQVSIQVASFTSRQRADQFRDFLVDRFGSAEIGEPKRYDRPPS